MIRSNCTETIVACSTHINDGNRIHKFSIKMYMVPLWRPRHRLKNIKLDFWEVGCDDANWAQDRRLWWAVVKTILKFRVFLNYGECLDWMTTVSFWSSFLAVCHSRPWSACARMWKHLTLYLHKCPCSAILSWIESFVFLLWKAFD